MLKSILVPVDGSENAEKALLLAADIAAKFDAKLVLLHAIPDTEVPEALKHYAETEHIDGPPSYIRYKYVAEGIMRDAKRHADEAGARDVETAFADGDPATAILEYAVERGINMIVMGSRGLSTLKGLLMGSVSRKVTELAPCSCLTVK